MKNGSGWILEVDIRKFFDTLDHAHLRELLRQRVRDGVVLRLIGVTAHPRKRRSCVGVGLLC